MSENIIFTYCIALLARREYSQQELRQKIQQKHGDNLGDNSADVDAVLSRLQADGYQSDARFAEVFTRSRINRRVGVQKIRYELKQKGIASDLIEQALSEYADTQLDNAKALIQRKIASQSQNAWHDRQFRAKINRLLVNKGYDFDTIRAAFEAVNDE